MDHSQKNNQLQGEFKASSSRKIGKTGRVCARLELMVKNESGRIKFQRTLYHQARVDRRRADRAFEQRLTRQHLVLTVVKYCDKDLMALGHQLQTQIIAN